MSLQIGNIASLSGMLDSETVVIDRREPGANPVIITRQQIYSGPCDVQSGGGTQYRNPSGVVEIAEALLQIVASAAPALPDVHVGDRATVTQNGVTKEYNIDNVALFVDPLPHIEAVLKSGPGTNKLA